MLERQLSGKIWCIWNVNKLYQIQVSLFDPPLFVCFPSCYFILSLSSQRGTHEDKLMSVVKTELCTQASVTLFYYWTDNTSPISMAPSPYLNLWTLVKWPFFSESIHVCIIFERGIMTCEESRLEICEYLIKYWKIHSRAVAHTFNPSTREAEAGASLSLSPA